MKCHWIGFHRGDYFCGRLCTIKLSTNAMKNISQSHPCNLLVIDKKPSYYAYPQILAINDPNHQHHHCCHQFSTGLIMMAISCSWVSQSKSPLCYSTARTSILMPSQVKSGVENIVPGTHDSMTNDRELNSLTNLLEIQQ